ncbi:cyclic nucleotide-binding domain-containing protein [uncultured Thiodictyon sp.]|uniref:Crp/Fnr family transcriptional regulator n=1 Tax=uncultured Thiodictyon sp. TaxID=1846217 RepID=UPI0025D50942|nr:cyclic nucleotide-binding domain-containing protein [uncultured Thiodictyon sp.]
MIEVNKLDALRNSLLAAEFDEAEIEALANQMGVQTLHDGETLVVEGDERRTLFTVAAGGLSFFRVIGGAEEIIYHMHAGECVGARSFIDGVAYVFGLRAIGETSLLTLEPEAFEALVDTHPWIIYRVMRALFRVAHVNLTRTYLEGAELRNYLLKSGGRY